MMDINSECQYPASALSNFENYEFCIDNIQCNSMEGFLQSLKFSNIEKQISVCLLIGKKAKFMGKKRKWFLTQTLYWLGQEIHRNSQEYQDLLDRAFKELSKNTNFQKTLLDTSNEIITHSIGKQDTTKTILTENEFCSRLMKIRYEIQQNSNKEKSLI